MGVLDPLLPFDKLGPAAHSAVGRSERAPRITALLYVAATFSFYALWRAFMAERSSDEAYFENCLWNAAHGNGLRTWIEGGGRHHLALHFSPILYLLVPLYAIAPSMHVVHFVVVLGVAGAGWVVYQMARDSLESRTALLLMLSFLLNPTVVLQTFMEFHEQALLFFPGAMLLREFRSGRSGRAAFWGLMVASVREDNLLLLGMLAFLAARRRFRLALALWAVSIGWFALCAGLSVRTLGEGSVSHLFAATYGNWGSTPSSALHSLVHNPGHVMAHLFSRSTLTYLVQLLAPFLGFLPFGSPISIAMIPQLILILMADHATRLLAIRMHYSIVPVLFLTVGTLATLQRMSGLTLRVGGKPRPLVGVCVMAMFLFTIATVPIWLTRALGRFHPDPRGVQAIMNMVPDTASVTAPGYVLNHMAARRMIAKTWSGDLTYSEFVILEVRRARNADRGDLEVPFSAGVADTLVTAGYHEIYAADGWHVWRRPGGPAQRPTRW